MDLSRRSEIGICYLAPKPRRRTLAFAKRPSPNSGDPTCSSLMFSWLVTLPGCAPSTRYMCRSVSASSTPICLETASKASKALKPRTPRRPRPRVFIKEIHSFSTFIHSTGTWPAAYILLSVWLILTGCYGLHSSPCLFLPRSCQ